MLYSLKEALLNEAIITQQNFISRLIDIVKKRPAAAGVKNCNSYEDIVDAVKKSIRIGAIMSDSSIQIDDLNLSREEADFYIRLKREFKDKEESRLKTVEIKKSKGIKLSQKDQTPIRFNSGIFFKRWNEQKAIEQVESGICAELVKIVEFFDVLTAKNKKSRKSLEQVVIDQIRKHKNIDGSPVEIRNILPLYDSMLEFISNKGDVNINDCIMAADLYMKELYKNADAETIDKMELGDVDFSEVFVKTKYYEEFMQDFILNQKNLLIYEDDKVKITYPTGNFSFNRTIRNYKRADVTWCTKMLSSWLYHTNDKQQYVCIMNVKGLDRSHQDYIISLKVLRDGSIDYNDTCDANNDHMNIDSVTKYLSQDALEEIKRKTKDVLQNVVYDDDKDINEIVRIAGNLAKSDMFFALQTLVGTFLCSDWSHDNLWMILKNIYVNTDQSSHKDFYKLMITTVCESYFNEEEADSDHFKHSFNLKAIGTQLVSYDKDKEDSPENQKVQLDESLFLTAFIEILKNKSNGFAGVMYYKGFNELLNPEIKSKISDKDLIDIYEVAFSTNNADYFSNAIDGLFISSYADKYLSLEDLQSQNPSSQLQAIKNIVINSRGFKSFLRNSLSYTIAYVRSNIKKDDKSLHPYGRSKYFLFSLAFEDFETTAGFINQDESKDQNKNIDNAVLTIIGGMLVDDAIALALYLVTQDESELEKSVISYKNNTGLLNTKYLSEERYFDICKNLLEDYDILSRFKQLSTDVYDKLLRSILGSLQQISYSVRNASDEIKEKAKKLFIFALENPTKNILDRMVTNFDLVVDLFKDARSMPELALNNLKSCFILQNTRMFRSYSMQLRKIFVDSGREAEKTLDFLISMIETLDSTSQELFCIDALNRLISVVTSKYNFDENNIKYFLEKMPYKLSVLFNRIIDREYGPAAQRSASGQTYSEQEKLFFQTLDYLVGIVNTEVFSLVSDTTFIGVIKALYRPMTADRLDRLQNKYIRSGLVPDEDSEIALMVEKSKMAFIKRLANRPKINWRELKVLLVSIGEFNKKEIRITPIEVIDLLKIKTFVNVTDVRLIVEFKKRLIKNLFLFGYDKDPQKIIEFMKSLKESTRGDLSRVPRDHSLRRSAMSIIDSEFDKETADTIMSSVYDVNRTQPQSSTPPPPKDPRDIPFEKLRRKIRLPGSQSQNQEQLANLSSLNPYGDLDDSQNESILRKYIKELLN